MLPYILIIDGQIAGTTTGEDRTHYLKIPAPDGFIVDALAEYRYDAATQELIHDPAAALARAKSERLARIKTEAAERLAATDWQVQRARERETTGYGTLAETAALLAAREAVRQSSNVAEQAILAMTDPAAIRAFTWIVDADVIAPRLVTHKQFADRFTDAELQAILAAAAASPVLRAWWEKFKLAQDINLDDPVTQMGAQALEMAGLIGAGRAAEILSVEAA